MIVWIKEIIKKYNIKDLFTLGAGTTLAQSIPILASPILTRLFSPDDFGLYANFMAIVAVLLVFYSGKYELAIILPRTNKEAVNVLSLCFIVISIVAIICLILSLFTGHYFAHLLSVPSIENWFWLVPIGAFLSSFYLVLNEWYIRKGNFWGLSRNRISNTSGISGSSLIFGGLKLNIGLILGQVLGQIFSVFVALRHILKEDKALFKYVSKKRVLYFARRYINFSKYIIPGHLINTFAGQSAIFLITFKYGVSEAGLLALVDRIFGVPGSVIGNAIRDAYKQKVAQEYQEKGSCLKLYKKILKLLFGVSIIPFVLLFFLAPFLFTIIFGDEWLQAGIYARYLCVMYFLNFISMPMGWLFAIAEKQKLELLWQAMFLVLTIVPLLIGILLKDSKITIILWGTGRSISYLVFLLLSYNIAKGKFKRI